MEKTEITPDNYEDLLERGAFHVLNSDLDLTDKYHLFVEELKYINNGSYNIVFEFLGIDGKTEGFRPLIFRVSKSPFYKHKIEPETVEVSTLSRIKNYLLVIFHHNHNHNHNQNHNQNQKKPRLKIILTMDKEM